MNSFVNPQPRIARPPMRWENARNFSGANFRSAHWLLKNMPTIEATGKALRMSDCWPGVNPRLGRDPKISGSHAPQMKNSSTIMKKSRYLAGEAEELMDSLWVGCALLVGEMAQS